MCGRAQSYPVGPTLFILYMNDLDTSLNNSVQKVENHEVFPNAHSMGQVPEKQQDLDKV